MGEGELLDFAEARAARIQRDEVDLLRAAYQWSVVHAPERLDAEEPGRPGRERARQLGGEGTAAVNEFAAAELGARIGRSPAAAAALIADAQDLRHRLPRIWRRVEAGEVRASYARHVAARSRELARAAADVVDEEVVEAADGRICWSRFEALVEGAVVKAAPELARRKEEVARRARFAKRLRTDRHGMGSFLIRAEIGTIEQIDAVVGQLADRIAAGQPEDPAVRESEDDRRVHAVLLLANPGADETTDVRELTARARLYVHVSAESPEVARVEGHGPVTMEWVRWVLGRQAKVTVTPVVDLAGQAPVDGYEVPARHREAVHLMTPFDVFPYASNTSRSKQVDHTVPYSSHGPPGQSRIGNYGPMTIRHHRVKTHGSWSVRQPFPGIYVWRDPHGRFYLVDHTGTRRLPRPPVTLDYVA